MSKKKPFIYSRLTNDHFFVGVLHVGRRVIPWAVVLISLGLISATLGVLALVLGSPVLANVLGGFLITLAVLGVILGIYSVVSWMYRVTVTANRTES